jgi:hypothetical protein
LGEGVHKGGNIDSSNDEGKEGREIDKRPQRLATVEEENADEDEDEDEDEDDGSGKSEN